MAKLRKGDTVVVITGKDKGKQGTILAVKDDKVKVEGINIVKKHQKPNQMTGQDGKKQRIYRSTGEVVATA